MQQEQPIAVRWLTGSLWIVVVVGIIFAGTRGGGWGAFALVCAWLVGYFMEHRSKHIEPVRWPHVFPSNLYDLLVSLGLAGCIVAAAIYGNFGGVLAAGAAGAHGRWMKAEGRIFL